MDNLEENKYTKKFAQTKYITCPHCGHQYTPDEVLYADNVIGKVIPTSIVRDPIGKILYCDYKDIDRPLLEESFICDNCNRPFVVEIEFSCKAKKEVDELDFSENATVQLW